MSTTTHATAEDLLRLPSGKGRYQLVKGELIAKTPAGYEHGDVASEIDMLLRQFVKQHRLGRVSGAETGFLLERDPDMVNGIRCCVRAAGADRPDGDSARLLSGPPDLAVEVILPS